MKIRKGLHLFADYDAHDNLVIRIVKCRVIFMCVYDFESNVLRVIFVLTSDKSIIIDIVNTLTKMGLADDLRMVIGSRTIKRLLMKK